MLDRFSFALRHSFRLCEGFNLLFKFFKSNNGMRRYRVKTQLGVSVLPVPLCILIKKSFCKPLEVRAQHLEDELDETPFRITEGSQNRGLVQSSKWCDGTNISCHTHLQFCHTYVDRKRLVAVLVGSVLVANGYRMKLSCIITGILTIYSGLRT